MLVSSINQHNSDPSVGLGDIKETKEIHSCLLIHPSH